VPRIEAPSPRGLLVGAGWRRRAARSAVAVALTLLPGRLRAQGTDLPPAGFGTLRQDQVAVRMTSGNVAVRVLPLDEHVIRLLSPDTYSSLHQLVESRAADIAAAASAAGRDSATAFIVTFFALQPQAAFAPDQLYIAIQGNYFRPIGIIPLTPRWSEYRLDQRQQATAIYLFDPSIPILQPFTLSYGDVSSTAWASSVSLLAGERARALARAAQQPHR
jgi:hypothetical protein